MKLSSEKEISVYENIKRLIQFVKDNNYNFNKIVKVVDYEAMEQIEQAIQVDRSILINFFRNEYPNFQQDDKIILLTCILFDLVYLPKFMSSEEFHVYFGELGIKAVANKLGLVFEQTYQDDDIWNIDIININKEAILKLGSYGIEILFELINYEFTCELKYDIIARLTWILKKYDNPYKQEIAVKFHSYFKNYHPIVPILAQQGYLDSLSEEELEIFAQNISKVIKFDHVGDSNLNISLLKILRTRLKRLDIIKRKNNLESLMKGIWKIIEQGDEYELKLVLINFLEYIRLPTFLDFIKETFGLKKDPFRKLMKGYAEKYNFKKYLEAFVLIYIKCESPDDWDNFFKIHYDFFLKVYRLIPANLKHKTKNFLLMTFSQEYDWRIYGKLLSDKIILHSDDIRNVDEKSYRKII